MYVRVCRRCILCASFCICWCGCVGVHIPCVSHAYPMRIPYVSRAYPMRIPCVSYAYPMRMLCVSYAYQYFVACACACVRLFVARLPRTPSCIPLVAEAVGATSETSTASSGVRTGTTSARVPSTSSLGVCLTTCKLQLHSSAPHSRAAGDRVYDARILRATRRSCWGLHIQYHHTNHPLHCPPRCCIRCLFLPTCWSAAYTPSLCHAVTFFLCSWSSLSCAFASTIVPSSIASAKSTL